MARRAQPSEKEGKRPSGARRAKGRALAFALAGVGLVLAVGLTFALRTPQERRAPGDEDRAAIAAAETFLNHWSRFEYGEALLLATGETRNRVLLAMDKELALTGAERETAEALRADVADVRLELRVHSIEDVASDTKLLRVTAYAHEEGEVFERNQTFRVIDDDGWKVSSWDTGRNTSDRER